MPGAIVNIPSMGGATILTITDDQGNLPLDVFAPGAYPYPTSPATYAEDQAVVIRVTNPEDYAECFEDFPLIISCEENAHFCTYPMPDNERYIGCTYNGQTYQVEYLNVNGVDVLAMTLVTSFDLMPYTATFDANGYATNWIEAFGVWANQNPSMAAIFAGWVLSREFPQSCEESSTPFVSTGACPQLRIFNAFGIDYAPDALFEIRIRGNDGWIFVYQDSTARHSGYVILDEFSYANEPPTDEPFESMSNIGPDTVSDIVPFNITVENAAATTICPEADSPYPATGVRHGYEAKGFLPETISCISPLDWTCCIFPQPLTNAQMDASPLAQSYVISELVINGVNHVPGALNLTFTVPAGARLPDYNGCIPDWVTAFRKYIQNRDAANGVGFFDMYHWDVLKDPNYSPINECDYWVWSVPALATFRITMTAPNGFTYTFEKT